MRRVGEQIGAGVPERQILGGDETRGADAPAHRRGGDPGVDKLRPVPIRAGEHQIVGQVGTGADETLESLDQADVVFGGMLDAGQVHQVGAREGLADAKGGQGLGRGGLEAAVVDAVPDHVDRGGRTVEKTLHIARGGVADGQEPGRLAGEAGDDVAAVGHAGGVVFPAHVKGRAIMYGDDLRAGGAGQDAAVAGDVDDLGTDGAEPAGQHKLVPEDVAHGGAPSLGDLDPSGAVQRAGEERAVGGEAEQAEPDLRARGH